MERNRKQPSVKKNAKKVQKIKNNRSVGESGILAEVLKYVGGKIKQRMSTLIK